MRRYPYRGYCAASWRIAASAGPSSLPAPGRPLSTVAGQARGNRSGTSSPPSAVYGWRATIDHARRVTSRRCPSSSLPQRDRIVVRVVRSRTRSSAAGWGWLWWCRTART